MSVSLAVQRMVSDGVGKGSSLVTMLVIGVGIDVSVGVGVIEGMDTLAFCL